MPQEDTPSLEEMSYPQPDQVLSDLIQFGFEIRLDDLQRTCQNCVLSGFWFFLNEVNIFDTNILQPCLNSLFYIIFYSNTCFYQNVTNQEAQQMKL